MENDRGKIVLLATTDDICSDDGIEVCVQHCLQFFRFLTAITQVLSVILMHSDSSMRGVSSKIKHSIFQTHLYLDTSIIRSAKPR